MNVDVAASDERAVEVLASGLSLLRSALSASGLPRFNVLQVVGTVLCVRVELEKTKNASTQSSCTVTVAVWSWSP